MSLFFLSIACAPDSSLVGPLPAEDSGSSILSDVQDLDGGAWPLAENKAWEHLQDLGVDPSHTLYFGRLPLVVDEHSAEMTWGAIEREGEALVVTQVDLFDGELLVDAEPLPENLAAFVEQAGLTEGPSGTTPNTYNSFPWSWQVPVSKTSALYKTYGYGHGSSYGDYYAVDFDPGNAGHGVESPASCWVMYTSYNSGYGWQVVEECGNAGGGRRYYTRVAHLRAASSVKPGWWVEKGRQVGEMGHTGNASGDHVHFVVYRATSTSGGSMYNYDTVPLNNWPASGDSLCGGAISGWNLSGNTTRNLGAIQGSSGCP